MSTLDETVTIIEDFNEVDGKIYYRWKVEGEKEWHVKETAMKQKPYGLFKYMTKPEYEQFYRRASGIKE